MKPNLNVPMPAMVAMLQRDDRGFPIPFFAPMRLGKPDFALADSNKLSQAIRERLCWICGMPLMTKLAFVGGPISANTKIFSDAPSHVECAEYAVQVCPFMAMPNYVKRACRQGTAPPGQDEAKPEKTCVFVTEGYQLAKVPGSNALLFAANDATEITWWKDGAKL